MQKALLASIKKLKSPTSAFITTGLIILVIAFISYLSAGSPSTTPFYVIIAAGFVLICIGAALEMARPGVSKARKVKSVMAQESVQLEEARGTLRALEAKAALIPPSERPISLTRDLEYQRELVARLTADDANADSPQQ